MSPQGKYWGHVPLSYGDRRHSLTRTEERTSSGIALHDRRRGTERYMAWPLSESNAAADMHDAAMRDDPTQLMGCRIRPHTACQL